MTNGPGGWQVCLATSSVIGVVERMYPSALSVSFVIVLNKYLRRSTLKRGKVYFGSQFEGIVYHGGKALVDRQFHGGRWFHGGGNM